MSFHPLPMVAPKETVLLKKIAQFVNAVMQESHIQIVIWNPKLSIVDASHEDKESDIKKLVCR